MRKVETNIIQIQNGHTTILKKNPTIRSHNTATATATSITANQFAAISAVIDNSIHWKTFGIIAADSTTTVTAATNISAVIAAVTTEVKISKAATANAA